MRRCVCVCVCVCALTLQQVTARLKNAAGQSPTMFSNASTSRPKSYTHTHTHTHKHTHTHTLLKYNSIQFSLCCIATISQITNLPQRALQSVHIWHHNYALIHSHLVAALQMSNCNEFPWHFGTLT